MYYQKKSCISKIYLQKRIYCPFFGLFFNIMSIFYLLFVLNINTFTFSKDIFKYIKGWKSEGSLGTTLSPHGLLKLGYTCAT